MNRSKKKLGRNHVGKYCLAASRLPLDDTSAC